MKLHQLVEALFWGLMDRREKYPGRAFPRQCMEGTKPLQTMLDGNGA